MNCYAAYPLKRGLGWWVMLRFARDARPHPVMEKGGKPKVFDTKGEAWEETAKHLLAFMNGHEIRGERFNEGGSIKDARRAQAERMFRNGKEIEVEQKGDAA